MVKEKLKSEMEIIWSNIKDKRITMEVRRQGVRGEKSLFLTELQMRPIGLEVAWL